MTLYEIRTRYYGESYERCYIWAASKERAIELFRERYPHREPSEVHLLLHQSNPEFITLLDDAGFER